ncbi:WD repeat-containing protein WRAP73-like, partial [Limulus polyphemus]|uniref:WD repeat-containing protein WRAP73-like n=1 Tax=Limulus polyphemus TaxID=6850 RepID=A0ABM1BJD9_LIMPO
MNFSQLFKQTNGQCEFSPDGRLLAYTNSQRLVIRDVQSLQVVCQFTCVDSIEKIEWASDSTYILCGMFKRRVVQVWSVQEPTWTCKIDEGSLGLIDVLWSPDGRHILTTAKFHLRITVWSLVNKSVSYIKYPKATKPGLAFRNDGKYLALAERRDCKDYISIFVCSTWQHIK